MNISEAITDRPRWAEYIIKDSPDIPRSELITRQTGRTTAIAFKRIGEAMAEPNTRVILEDHYPTARSNEHLRAQIQEIIKDLKLEKFIITRKDGKPALMFELNRHF